MKGKICQVTSNSSVRSISLSHTEVNIVVCSVLRDIVTVEKVLLLWNVLVMMNGLIRGCVPDRQALVDEDVGRIRTLPARRIPPQGETFSFDCSCGSIF